MEWAEFAHSVMEGREGEPMTTIKNWRRVERWPTGHFNPHDNLIVGDIELESGHGRGDSLLICREGGMILVLCTNRSLGYAGLAAYDTEHTRKLADGAPLDATCELFLQADHELDDVLGARGLALTERTIMRRLWARLREVWV